MIETAQLVTLIAAIIAASVSAFGVWQNSRIAEQNRRRDASAAIAAYRIKWAENLRHEVSNIMSLSMTIHTLPDQGELALKRRSRLNAHAHATSLLLTGNDPKHHELEELVYEVISLLGSSSDLAYPKMLDLRDATRKILKTTWEQIKTETSGESTRK